MASTPYPADESAGRPGCGDAVSSPSAAASAARLRVLPWTACDTPAFHAAWDRLAARAAEPNPFCESWYLRAALAALDPAGEVQLACCEADGELIGVVPLGRYRRYYRWPFPHLGGWTHPNAFLGLPLVAAGEGYRFWRALLGWADRQAGLGLFLHLPDMPLAGELHHALADVLAQQGRDAALVHREERALLHSALGPDAYFAASLTGKKRKELRRQQNRLAEMGDLRFTRQTDGAGLADWIDAFLALELAGWKGRAGSALASRADTTALFREALHGAASRGRLERLGLWLDGRPIAMLASFITPPGAFSYKTAFDEDYARFSPGVLLQTENLQVLTRPDIAWSDSCAGADHPMIDRIWREKRAIGRFSIAIGGRARRALFRLIVRAELRQNPTGIA